jgi:hypothetical protein
VLAERLDARVLCRGIPAGEGGVGSVDSPFFIDGACEQAQFAGEADRRERSLGTYANHSSKCPNAGYLWQVQRPRAPHSLAGSLWIVALEHIAAGEEVRVDYEAEGRAGQYW